MDYSLAAEATMRNTGWLKIAISIVVFLGFAGAALVKIMIEEPPGYATAPRIETRFSAQLSILAELAASHPLDSCVEEEPVSRPAPPSHRRPRGLRCRGLR